MSWLVFFRTNPFPFLMNFSSRVGSVRFLWILVVINDPILCPFEKVGMREPFRVESCVDIIWHATPYFTDPFGISRYYANVLIIHFPAQVSFKEPSYLQVDVTYACIGAIRNSSPMALYTPSFHNFFGPPIVAP